MDFQIMQQPTLVKYNEAKEGDPMVGERIKDLREKHNMTQTALARRLGLSRSAVNAWEMGVSIPSVPYLLELSELFRVSVDYLLGRSRAEMVDISSLSAEEKQVIYSLLRSLSIHSAE